MNTANRQPKNFGFVTLGANVPSTRFRFFPYRSPLEARGYRCKYWTSYPSVYDYFPTIGWRLSYQLKKAVRTLQWLDAKRLQPDAIYLERGCFHDQSLFMDERFRKCTKRFVLDVDDGIFLQFPDKVKRLIEMCDHIVVSNRPIFEYVQPYHSHITEIPTCVPLQRFTVRPEVPSSSDKLVIGWMGTTSNLAFMSVCATALRTVSKEHSLELLVIAPTDEPLRHMDLSGVPIRFEKWTPDGEVRLLHQMDIGIMPLPDNQDWMRYKAATKLVQYMATGIPAVASPIGVNAEILRDNRVGFAAADTDEWVQALRTLLKDAGLRLRMGREGRRLAEEKFSIEANVGKLESVLIG